MARKHERGYTLIEIIIVFTMIGIPVSLALPEYRNAVKKAKEAALKEDLFQFRKLIDQYFSDKGKYPASLKPWSMKAISGKIRPIPSPPGRIGEVMEEPSARSLSRGRSSGSSTSDQARKPKPSTDRSTTHGEPSEPATRFSF